VSEILLPSVRSGSIIKLAPTHNLQLRYDLDLIAWMRAAFERKTVANQAIIACWNYPDREQAGQDQRLSRRFPQWLSKIHFMFTARILNFRIGGRFGALFGVNRSYAKLGRKFVLVQPGWQIWPDFCRALRCSIWGDKLGDMWGVCGVSDRWFSNVLIFRSIFVLWSGW